MKSGSISYSPDYKSEKTQFDAVCGGCGAPYSFHNAKVIGALNWKQFCTRKCEAAPDPKVELARLEREVIEKCSAYCASVVDMEENGWPKDMTKDEWHHQRLLKQTAMIDAHKALVAFEAEQEKKS